MTEAVLIFSAFTVINLLILALNLKLYTEILKDKNMNRRSTTP